MLAEKRAFSDTNMWHSHACFSRLKINLTSIKESGNQKQQCATEMNLAYFHQAGSERNCLVVLAQMHLPCRCRYHPPRQFSNKQTFVVSLMV